ncbi:MULTISPECIES: MerR family transcriptional regulator [Saccharopolyspora]|uniref:MerR family transcriptional regulator n=1 Tax=Saccharopolyspora TaxID=1835 RepID=UPI00190C090D|nr:MULTISPECIES: HTH domain-containing protein [Saccharopolyspora]MBK0870537.1 HTH domain-containing protein [Saccharopolyspora sp. HNM0986]
MPRPKLLTSSQLADELGISRRSVARYVQAGILEPEFYTPGGQGRFDLEDSKRQLREHSKRQRP